MLLSFRLVQLVRRCSIANVYILFKTSIKVKPFQEPTKLYKLIKMQDLDALHDSSTQRKENVVGSKYDGERL